MVYFSVVFSRFRSGWRKIRADAKHGSACRPFRPSSQKVGEGAPESYPQSSPRCCRALLQGSVNCLAAVRWWLGCHSGCNGRWCWSCPAVQEHRFEAVGAGREVVTFMCQRWNVGVCWFLPNRLWYANWPSRHSEICLQSKCVWWDTWLLHNRHIWWGCSEIYPWWSKAWYWAWIPLRLWEVLCCKIIFWSCEKQTDYVGLGAWILHRRNEHSEGLVISSGKMSFPYSFLLSCRTWNSKSFKLQDFFGFTHQCSFLHFCRGFQGHSHWTARQVSTSFSGPLRKLSLWGGTRCPRQMWSLMQVLLWKSRVLKVIRWAQRFRLK